MKIRFICEDTCVQSWNLVYPSLEDVYIRYYIKTINKIIGDFGAEINNKTIEDMKLKSKYNLETINKISKDKFHKTFKSIPDFMESDEYTSSAYDDKIFY